MLYHMLLDPPIVFKWMASEEGNFEDPNKVMFRQDVLGVAAHHALSLPQRSSNGPTYIYK